MKQSLVQNAFRCKVTNIFPFRKCFSGKITSLPYASFHAMMATPTIKKSIYLR